MSRRARHAIVIPAALTAATLVSVGCSSSNPVHALRMDPTPEIETLSDTKVEIDNRLWLTQDMNGRMFWEDAARALHLDRPSRLSPAPIPD